MQELKKSKCRKIQTSKAVYEEASRTDQPTSTWQIEWKQEGVEVDKGRQKKDEQQRGKQQTSPHSARLISGDIKKTANRLRQTAGVGRGTVFHERINAILL